MSNMFEDFNKPDHFSDEAWEKTLKDLKRVEKLRSNDLPHEDSAHELANVEDANRSEMLQDGLPGELAEKYADRMSSLVLDKMEAKREGWIDDLTKAWNREALMDLVPRLMSFEQRDGKDCLILMLDFDEFKTINDSHGHLAGDQALRTMATVIRRSVRRSDLVFRFGGDEFTIVLLGTPSQPAKEIAEKIRQSVSNQIFTVNNERGQAQRLRRTVSIGLIGTDQFPEWKESKDDGMADLLEEMIKKADGALYAAKELGKSVGSAGNMVVAYVPETEKSD